MDFKVLDESFKVIAIIDNFKSLMWCKRYNEIGALDLQIDASVENLKIFKKGNYIARDDDDSVYRIEAVEIDTEEGKDNSLIIGGFDLKKLLDQRVVYETEVYNNTVENVIREIITNNIINPINETRKINNFILKPSKGFDDVISTQITYQNIGEKISSLCKTYNYGYKVFLEDGNICFDLFKGIDKTSNQKENPRVVFSTEYENVNSSKYNLDASEYKNVALVGGEGEGANRKNIEAGSASGIDRFEIFVDASSISSNDGKIGEADYKKLLLEQGKEELSKNSITTTFEAVVDTSLYRYKKDFDLGDIVTISNEYGISVDARIAEIIETWDENGYNLEPSFEYKEVNEVEIEVEDIVDKSLLTENGAMLLANSRSVPLLMEDSTSTSGIKISELEAVTELYGGCCLPIVQNNKTKKVAFEVLREEIIDNLDIPETGGTSEEIFNMIKEYNSKQNLLSDIETISTTPNTDNIAEYDGYLIINLTKSSSETSSSRKILVNGITIYVSVRGSTGATSGEMTTIPLKKGDTWTIDIISETNIYARWYKERDYGGRS